jgi:hypothetical protein
VCTTYDYSDTEWGCGRYPNHVHVTVKFRPTLECKLSIYHEHDPVTSSRVLTWLTESTLRQRSWAKKHTSSKHRRGRKLKASAASSGRGPHSCKANDKLSVIPATKETPRWIYVMSSSEPACGMREIEYSMAESDGMNSLQTLRNNVRLHR